MSTLHPILVSSALDGRVGHGVSTLGRDYDPLALDARGTAVLIKLCSIPCSARRSAGSLLAGLALVPALVIPAEAATKKDPKL